MTRSQLTTLSFTVALGLCLVAVPVAAKVGGAPKAPTVKTTGARSVGVSGKHGGTTAGAPKASKGHSGSVAPKGATAKATGGGKTAKTTTSGSSKSGHATSGTGGGVRTGSATTLNKAQQQLTKNTQLRTKIESRMAPGTDVIAAASGFRNLGQFEAAVNASHNQGYSFEGLKALMTGPNAVSLGQAKKQLRGTTTTGGSAPPTGSGGSGTSTVPPTGSGGSGTSTVPPTGSGGTSTKPHGGPMPPNTGSGGTSTSPASGAVTGVGAQTGSGATTAVTPAPATSGRTTAAKTRRPASR